MDYKIMSIGEYYTDFLKSCMIPLQIVCHIIKEQNTSGFGMVAPYVVTDWVEAFHHDLKDSILIPVPSRSTRNEMLCLMLAQRMGLLVSYCLKRTDDKSIYTLKKEGKHINGKSALKPEDVPIVLGGPIPKGKIVLVDNVVATGLTIERCTQLLDTNCDVLTIAYDSTAKLKQQQYGILE